MTVCDMLPSESRTQDFAYSSDASAAVVQVDDIYSSTGHTLRTHAHKRMLNMGDSGAETLSITSRCLAIDALTRIGNNWDSYGGEPPNAEAAHWAKTIVALLDSSLMTRATIMASAEGGIGIAFHQGGRYADIEVFNSGDILAIISDGAGGTCAWEVKRSTPEIVQALNRIRDYIKW